MISWRCSRLASKSWYQPMLNKVSITLMQSSKASMVSNKGTMLMRELGLPASSTDNKPDSFNSKAKHNMSLTVSQLEMMAWLMAVSPNWFLIS